MKAFNDSEHFYSVVGEFLKVPTSPRSYEDLRRWWGENPAYHEEGDEIDLINGIGQKVAKTRMSAEFVFSEPEALICMDAENPRKGEHFSVYLGDSPIPAALSVKTTGDMAHQFWAGNVSLTAAIMTGKIKTKGSKQKALKLLPRIAPAFALYPRYLEIIGEQRLLRML
ncbi:hypothetical protein EPH95_13335 [Salicibibacter halophilus]|uniref:SCP2 domain-containing protein n=1 Tax=Salicibibacter halophilus TaxID=2502791 RepID=A0A514LJK0_9BACI|nr:hypothetical protein [Salicibibacter halophilus]QDI92040.1 hypothetical protein EPH95_13335 [Salicibibacter halophilus]